MTDTSNFGNSTFWDSDPVSGIGGWGDLDDDNQITDGAFATDFAISYPSPHRIRRQYAPIIPDFPVPLTDTFTHESQIAMVNDFVGTFVGFQAYFQKGSHANVHRIVGGCASLLGAP